MGDTEDHHEPPDEAGTDPGKAGIRAQMKAKLAAMSPEERRDASRRACLRLAELEAFRNASVIMLYMPLETEVDTTPAAIRCFQAGKTVCVPRVNWQRKSMNAVSVNSFDDHFMETDDHGVRTPRDGALIVPGAVDLVVVPGLAFDTQGCRLGRGGGYYDRFLGRLRRATVTIGLAFDVQILDQVPIDERDVRVNLVVTDRRVCGSLRSRTRR